MIEDKIKELLEHKYKEEGFEDFFTVDIVQNNSKIQVFIDSDTKLNLAMCQKISRYLEAIIDEAGWLGEKYTLEVSSPGATRPLISRQYPKHIGRKVKAKTADEEYEGVLEKVENDKIVVAFTTVEKIKKKKIKTEVKKEIDFNDIHELKVIISF